MEFSIRITELCLREIDEAAAFIEKDSRDAAHRWEVKLSERLIDLLQFPGRFGLIPESDDLGVPYRSFVHISHRVIYRVDESRGEVVVVAVRHISRDRMSSIAED